MDVVEVLPDELADARVFWDGFIATVFSFIMQGRSLDATVVDKGPSNVRYL